MRFSRLEIASTYRIVNHNARELSEHRFLGNTKSGTPVYIAEDFVAADLHITLGFIEPHLMAGFSGARKLVAPGLAAQETIKVLHSPKFMRDSKAVEGSIEGNPLHRELLEIAQMAGHHFMVDVALTRDRQIAGVFAGEPVAGPCRRGEVRVASDAGATAAPGGRSDHQLRRVPARPDVLSGDQRHHRCAAHREKGRQNPAGGRMPGRARARRSSATC